MKTNRGDLRFLIFRVFFFIELLTNTFIASAQTTDFRTWGSIAIEKSFTKKLDGILEQEVRLKHDPVQLVATFTDASLKYEALKNLDVEVHLRFIIAPGEVAYRPYAEVTYKFELKKWSLEPRIRYQHQIQKNEFAENYLRPRLTMTYKIDKKWEPYVYGELFYHLFYYRGDQFDEYRLSAGISYDANKNHRIKVYYLFDHEFNVNDPEQSHVLGVAYKYSF